MKRNVLWCALVLLVSAVRVTDGSEVQVPTFTDETETRLNASASVGAEDDSEKDYGLGDFDNDGDIDVLSARRIALKINTGLPERNTLFMNERGVLTNRTAAFAPALNAPTRSRDVAIADFNSDGWLDALIVHGPSTLPTLLINLGESGGQWLGFEERADRLPAGFLVDGWSVSAGDLTGNAHPDAFVGVRTGTDRVLINLGVDKSGRWLGFVDESDRLGANANTTAVRSSQLADINNDGDLDLIQGQTCCDGIVRVISNDGTGTLSGTPQTVISGFAYNFALGHIDDDGLLDIVGVRNSLDQYRLNAGPDGDGVAWSPVSSLPGSNGFGSIVRVGDLNSDGRDDFLICDLDQEFPENCSRRLNIYFNSGSSPFLVEGYPVQQLWTPNGTSDVALLDLDEDGDLDMLIGWCNGQSVFMQNGAPESCDVTGDGVNDTVDLLVLLGAWGPCAGCDEDRNGDNVVDTLDLLELLANWGPCT